MKNIEYWMHDSWRSEAKTSQWFFSNLGLAILKQPMFIPVPLITVLRASSYLKFGLSISYRKPGVSIVLIYAINDTIWST